MEKIMKPPNLEEVEREMYLDYLYLDELETTLNERLIELMFKRNIRNDPEGIQKIKDICLEVTGRFPKKIDINMENGCFINLLI